MFLLGGYTLLRGGNIQREVTTSAHTGARTKPQVERAQRTRELSSIKPQELSSNSPLKLAINAAKQKVQQLRNANPIEMIRPPDSDPKWGTALLDKIEKRDLCAIGDSGGIGYGYARQTIKNCDILYIGRTAYIRRENEIPGRRTTSAEDYNPWSFAAVSIMDGDTRKGESAYINLICAPPTQPNVGGPAGWQLIEAIKNDTVNFVGGPKYIRLSAVTTPQAIRSYWKAGFRFIGNCSYYENKEIEKLIHMETDWNAKGGVIDILMNNYRHGDEVTMIWCREANPDKEMPLTLLPTRDEDEKRNGELTLMHYQV